MRYPDAVRIANVEHSVPREGFSEFRTRLTVALANALAPMIRLQYYYKLVIAENP